jgi:hypothetical protein
MRLRTLALSLAPLLAASLAHAQAPGEVAAQPVVVQPVVVAPVVAQPVVVAPVVIAAPAAQPAPMLAPMAAPMSAPMGPPMAPGFAPVVPEAGCALPCVNCRESVMSNRWSLGLSVGSMSLAPKDSPDDQTAFALGQLALRFRATPHLELELAVGGGRERTADDQDGDLEVNTAALALRYRFRPEAAWNWFAMVGVGGASVTRHDATKQERDDAMQPLGMLGIGVERRFRHFALQAEVRAVGLGKHQDDAKSDAPMAEAMTVTTTSADAERSGGAFSLGLSYYF